MEGRSDCLPSPYDRFRNDFPGLESPSYIVVTAFTKGGKSQFVSHTFIFKPLLDSYLGKIRQKIRILYFPLEESPERVMQRFMSWALFQMTDGEIHVSPSDLRSVRNPLPEKVLDMIEGEEFRRLMDWFEDHVLFYEESSPGAIYNICKGYAEKHGKVYRKTDTVTDETGEEKKIERFDHYEQDDPDEIRIIVIDTINLIEPEPGLTRKESIDKLSRYLLKYARNRYGMSSVVVQQQAFEGESVSYVRSGNVNVTVGGLGDSKYTGRDVNMVLGLFSPYRFSIWEYEGYDITRFRDNIRFLKVMLNRDGIMGGVCPLLFDGAVCSFQELPRPENTRELQKFYRYLDKIRKQQ